MKHLLLPCITLLLMLSTVSQAVGQDTYEILRIYNANSITIGNRQKKVGDRFKLNEHIDFANERQSFYAQKLGTSKTYYFSKETMKAKKAKSLKDYFTNNYHKVKGSTRGESGNFPEISQGEHNIANYPEKRIALVIGNGNYNDLEILPNALNDARDVSDRLKQLGFDVVTLYDADINDMQTTVTSFFHLAQSYQVALIYFAGHGLRYEGKDYLLAIDRADLSIKDECSLDYLIEESEKWKSNGKVMIFVIDACRNQAGFANAGDYRAIAATKGTAILQSTSSGRMAMDADEGSGNSPFASVFINGIGSSENNIVEEFETISKEVTRKTSYHQEPMFSRNGVYNFYFCKNCKSTTSNSSKRKHNENTYTAAQLAELFQRGLEQYDKMNYEDAFRLFKIAAEGGDADGQNKLGICYKYGYGTTQSLTEAFKWFNLAAEQGNDWGQYNLGICYFYGEGVAQSYPKAYKLFLLSAEQGNSSAINSIGVCYEYGKGVLESHSEAVKWYRLSANQGNAKSYYNLGLCYFYGKGVTLSYSEAVRCLQPPAEKGDENAQFFLGLSYDQLESYSKAAKWFSMAADHGHSQAQYMLGWYYENGQGVMQSNNEAVKWYSLAANQGFAPAQYMLGSCYYTGGRGVAQSDSEAVRWFRKAAEQGHADAQFLLGVCYNDGLGIEKSQTEAKKWFQKAAEQGNEDAKKELNKM